MNSKQEQAELRSEQAFADLFGNASPRPAPPAADEAHVRKAVHAEWLSLMQRRLRRRRFTAFALAASVLLVFFVALSVVPDPMESFGTQQVARIGKQFGPVIIRNRGEIARHSVASIGGRDVVETLSAAGLELGLHNGGSMRLDENTLVVFEEVGQVYLQKGRIYFDSARNPLPFRAGETGRVGLRIRTDSGTVQHLGTQYMIEAHADGLTILVREGEVSLDGNRGLAVAGEQLAVSVGGSIEIENIDIYGDEWQWIHKTAPAVNLAGQKVAEALAWVGRETGRSIEYATPAAEAIAKEFSLVGFNAGTNLNPARALYIFAEMADLTVSIEGGVIVVRERTPEE